MHINNRYLNSSPTAATLRITPSSFALDSPPPLVSIHDPQLNKESSQKLSAKQPIVADRKQAARRAIAKKQITAIEQPQKQLFTSKQRPRYPFGPSHTHTLSPTNNNSKPNTNLNNGEQKDNSIVQSEYLNLEQYSSIHKYQSLSPYYEEEFDEDREYVKYLGNNSRQKNTHVSDIRINLQAEESIVRSRANKQYPNIPQLISIQPQTHIKHPNIAQNLIPNSNLIKIPTMSSNDTYTEMLSTQSPRRPQVKRTQSSIEPNKEERPEISPMRHSTMDAVRQKIYLQDQDNPDQNIKKSGNSGRFVPIDQVHSQVNSHKSQRSQKISKITKQAYELLPHPLPNLSDFSFVFSLEQPVQLQKLEPQWLSRNETNNSIRLILTKKNKLEEYLKYLAELEILVQSQNRQKKLEEVCTRTDLESGLQGNGNGNKGNDVTVYFDSDHKNSNNRYKGSGLVNNKQKISSQRQHKQSISLSSAKLLNMGSAISEAGHQSLKSRENTSDYISSLNVFTTNRYRTSTIPEAISQTNQQIQFDNNFLGNVIAMANAKHVKNNKNSSVNYNLYQNSGNDSRNVGSTHKNVLNTLFGNSETHQIQVLRLLEVLLVKLADKKCDVKVKVPNEEHGTVDDCDTLSSASRLRVHNNKKVQGNKLQQYYMNKGQSPFYLSQKCKRISIQFDQYIQSPTQAQKFVKNKSGTTSAPTASSLIMTQNSRLKALQQCLQQKDRYLQQIKSEYDHIVNNYITTISNLKNKKSEVNLSNLPYPIKNYKQKQKQEQKQEQEEQEQEQEQEENIVSSGVKKVQIDEDDQYPDYEKKNQEIIEGFRMSQPMTFQMSKNGNQSLLDEDHWIGNPGNDVENYITNHRKSSPSKN